MSSSQAAFSLDHLAPPPSEQLCYVHCNFCDTVLAVSVPCSSLFKTVTVRCGHCTNLLSVNMRGLLLPAANQLNLSHPFLSPAHHNLLEELQCPAPSLLMDQVLLNANTCNSNNNHSSNHNHNHNHNHSSIHSPNNTTIMAPVKGAQEELIPRNPVVNRPPEKRQRVPSAYNRFIKDEIQRIKAGNPDISHREAFSAAAKNWAHFPHIHFGLMPDQALKKASVRQQDGEDVLLKDGFYAAAAANMGVAPF